MPNALIQTPVGATSSARPSQIRLNRKKPQPPSERRPPSHTQPLPKYQIPTDTQPYLRPHIPIYIQLALSLTSALTCSITFRLTFTLTSGLTSALKSQLTPSLTYGLTSALTFELIVRKSPSTATTKIRNIERLPFSFSKPKVFRRFSKSKLSAPSPRQYVLKTLFPNYTLRHRYFQQRHSQQHSYLRRYSQQFLPFSAFFKSPISTMLRPFTYISNYTLNLCFVSIYNTLFPLCLYILDTLFPLCICITNNLSNHISLDVHFISILIPFLDILS